MARPKGRWRLRDRLGRSFLERNQRAIGLTGLILLLAASAFALLLSGGVFAHTYRVDAAFTDAAGIVPGDQVTVAGLKAGTVKGLQVEGDHVVMQLGVNRGVTLPADSRAEVVVQTLLGRETVQLVAGGASSNLHDGSVIPLTRTTTPVNINQLNDISVNLLEHSNADALNTFLQEVTSITQGKATQVKQLISGLGQVVEAVDARRTQLAGLIDALRSLSTTLGERDRTIVSLIDNLTPVLTDLAARQQDIQTLLVATDSASHATADLVARNRKVLDQTLGALHSDLQVIDQHQVDLAETVSYLNQSVQGYSSVGYSSGVPNQWANIFVQSLGPAGVDALLGPCGAVDQLIDTILGLNCNNETVPGGGGFGGGGSGSGKGGGGGSGAGGHGGGSGGGPRPVPTPTLGSGSTGGGSRSALPGSIGDFLAWTVASDANGGHG